MVDGQREVVADGADGLGVLVVLDAGAMPHDVVAERGEQQRERAVEVEAVAAAVPREHALGRVVRVHRRGPAELDLDRLVRDPLDVGGVQAAQRFRRRRARREAEAGEIALGVDGA
jgi:hypothetical protein